MMTGSANRPKVVAFAGTQGLAMMISAYRDAPWDTIGVVPPANAGAAFAQLHSSIGASADARAQRAERRVQLIVDGLLDCGEQEHLQRSSHRFACQKDASANRIPRLSVYHAFASGPSRRGIWGGWRPGCGEPIAGVLVALTRETTG